MPQITQDREVTPDQKEEKALHFKSRAVSLPAADPETLAKITNVKLFDPIMRKRYSVGDAT